MERYIRIGDLSARYGIPKSTVYYLIRTQKFPRPIKIGQRRVVWSVEEVEEWINRRRKIQAQK
ncbi:transcriptional regulator, AlpA family [Thermodesulforhabdus norvegica]|uniref:Transcriptional regulator, AlpA family n=2 Tax=Thermodesulforhabdus norvegica TaxID=39841 RepID=A0A1I4VKW4_9BACT|nr:transcriptional regulator, AlpA family [Thermodesulforhabdus norvegica]